MQRQDKESTLLWAVQNKQYDLVRKCIASGATGSAFECGKSPLHFAVLNQDVAMVSILINLNNDLAAKLDDDKKTAFFYAAEKGYWNIVMLFAEKLKDQFGLLQFGKGILEGVKANKYAEVRMLLEAHGNPNAYHDEQNRRALHIAASKCDARMVRLLLRHGANATLQAPIGSGQYSPVCFITNNPSRWSTAITFVNALGRERHLGSYQYGSLAQTAAMHNKVFVAEVFLKNGAEINEWRGINTKSTALQYAVQNNNPPMVALLTYYKASHIVYAGLTPLEMAKQKNYTDCISAMLDPKPYLMSLSDCTLLLFNFASQRFNPENENKGTDKIFFKWGDSNISYAVLKLVLNFKLSLLGRDNYVDAAEQGYVNFRCRQYLNKVPLFISEYNTSSKGWLKNPSLESQAFITSLEHCMNEDMPTDTKATFISNKVSRYVNFKSDGGRAIDLLKKHGLYSPPPKLESKTKRAIEKPSRDEDGLHRDEHTFGL